MIIYNSIKEYVLGIGRYIRKLAIGICVIWTLYSVAWMSFKPASDFVSILDDTKLETRIDITDMHSKIDVGDTRSVADDTLQKLFHHYHYWGVSTQRYKVHNMDDGSGYWVTAPPELGSSGWVLVVEFEDELVQFVGIRMDNNWNYYPRCAPLDKGFTKSEDWRIHEEVECIFARCRPSATVTEQMPVVQFAPVALVP